MKNKSDLPQKICVTCGRPFTWRKKWKMVWDEVKYCSDKCRSNKGNAKFKSGRGSGGRRVRINEAKSGIEGSAD